MKLAVDGAELHGARPLLPDGSGPAHLRRRGLRHDPRPGDRRPRRPGRGRPRTPRAPAPSRRSRLLAMTRPRRRHGRGPVRLLRRRPAAAGGLRGRPVRRAADALRARARRRRSRPPEDQVGHAHVREDRAASRLPLLRRRRARRRRDPGGPARPLPRGRLRRRHADRQPAGDPGRGRVRARSPPPSSSPGTTATPPHADAAFDLSCAARRRGRQRERRDSTSPACWCSTPTSSRRPTPPTMRSRRSPARRSRRSSSSAAAGPPQAAFTNPELRELGDLARADVVVDPAELALDPSSAAWLESGDASPTARRNIAMLREYAARGPAGKSHRIELRFCRSPLEVLGEGEDGPVTGLRVRAQPARAGPARRRAGRAHRRRGGHPLRARDPLDRLPRPPAARASRSTSAAG